MTLLMKHQWRGNVRELENAVERAINLASGDEITEADLPAELTVSPAPESTSARDKHDRPDAASGGPGSVPLEPPAGGGRPRHEPHHPLAQAP